MRRRRAFTLVSFLALSGISFLLGLLVLNLEDSLRHRLKHHRDGLQAHEVARSGLRFGRAMLAQGRWRQDVRFDSPPLEDGSRFHLETRRQGSVWILSVEGTCHQARCPLKGRYP